MGASNPKIENCSKLLVVEGVGDLLFYAAALDIWLGKDHGIFIKEMKGRPNILDRKHLGELLTPKELHRKTHIGLIIDADQDGPAAAQSLAAGIQSLTGVPVQEGCWSPASEEGRRIGFLVVPNALPHPEGRKDNREIETLVWEVWAAANPVGAEAIKGYLRTMKQINPRWQPKSADKGRLTALFAVTYDDDPRLGPATHYGKSFDLSACGFERLKQFLKEFANSG